MISKFSPAITPVMGWVLKQWIPALTGSTLRADAILQCCVIMFGTTLKLEDFWKANYITLMFWKVFLVMLTITSDKTCRPEISISIHVSSIDSTKCQKEKSQCHVLVQIFCTGKNVLNSTCVGEIFVQSSLLCPPFSTLNSPSIKILILRSHFS